MDRVNIETTTSPVIKIAKISGNLRLKGWDRPELRADCDQENALKIAQTQNTIEISSTAGCMLRIPMESTLQIGKVVGDLMIKSVEGQINVGTIHGQIMAKSVGPLALAEVGGAINARSIEGDFSCKQAMGSINLQDAEGNVEINGIKGNLVVKGFCGGLTASTDGNATLKIETSAEGSYQLNAKGDVFCQLIPEIDAAITLNSGAGMIKVQQETGTEIFKTSQHEIIKGKGTTKIILGAGGNLELIIPGVNEFDWEFELNLEKDIAAMAANIRQDVSDQIETQLDVLGDHLNNLSENLSSINPQIGKETHDRIEAKRAKLERKLVKVEARAAEKARQASRKITRRYTISSPQSDPVSDEERQKVLEMLQNKIISIEEAEALLAALEGNS
ncbi:MAG: hypothetical protein JW757_03085 [Anaerolineales bacterium]|nr:hypothetical protein [Anaerolineales bacterium]